jgi:N-methylhydantoinase A
MATVLNAYVQPIVGSYMKRLQAKLSGLGFRGRLWIMSSNGGVMSADAAGRQSIQLALSGPAAGVIGAQIVGARAGFDDLISIDIGGTSTDVCLVRGGSAEISTEGRIGHWPLQIPMVDIHTIGAGGGSIARLSEDGGIVVGPESAGAVPGPACYGAGGTLPTVTDANLVLGRVTPRLLAGRMLLDVEAARTAVAQIADGLGISVEEAAQGIIDIANNNLVGAIRLVSVERGYDPADFSLVAFGGAGPLHAADLVQLLGMRTAVVPSHPGVLSAIGMLASDVRTDFIRTSLHQPPGYDLERLEAVCRELEDDATRWLENEQVPAGDRRLQFSADLRYTNQGSELTIPWDWVGSEPLDKLVGRFHDRHEQLFTFALREVDVELVAVRVSAIGAVPHAWRDGRATEADRPSELAPTGVHGLYSRATRAYVDCPLYTRTDIRPGDTIQGPAVIEQFDTTTLVLDGQVATADTAGNLLIAGRA